jgi:hypothetical protein
MRQRGPDTAATIVSAISFSPTFDSRIPTSLVEEGFRRLEPALQPADVNQLRLFHWIFERIRGRPVTAERVLPDAANIFRIQFVPWAWFSGEARDDAAVLAKYGATPLTDSLSEGRRRCAWSIVRAAGGQADSLEASRMSITARCRRIAEGWKAFASGTVSDSTFATIEALVAANSYTGFYGYEHQLLSRIYESRGDIARARAAISQYPRDYKGAWLPATLLQQGRLAVLARDTSAALRVYEHYLELRADAEPPFTARRDSVRAIVSRMRR